MEAQLLFDFATIEQQIPQVPHWGIKKNSEGKNVFWFGFRGHLLADCKSQYILSSLFDSWFSSHEFIQTVRGLGEKPMHLVCGVRQDARKYLYKGNSLNASQLKPVLKNEGNEKRCRKRNIRYFEVLVDYEGIEQVKLFFCRFPYQKKWRLFLSADISLILLSIGDLQHPLDH